MKEFSPARKGHHFNIMEKCDLGGDSLEAKEEYDPCEVNQENSKSFDVMEVEEYGPLALEHDPLEVKEEYGAMEVLQLAPNTLEAKEERDHWEVNEPCDPLKAKQKHNLVRNGIDLNSFSKKVSLSFT